MIKHAVATRCFMPGADPGGGHGGVVDHHLVPLTMTS